MLGGTQLALTLVTVVEPLSRAFGFAPLAPAAWLAAVAAGLAMTAGFQLAKGLLGRAPAAS